jgi:hypothetical protein
LLSLDHFWFSSLYMSKWVRVELNILFSFCIPGHHWCF